MKAKEWVAKLTPLVENGEEFERVLGNCLESLIQDADKLISIRRAKSNEAVAACIEEVNNKWKSIIHGYETFMEKEYGAFKDHFMILLPDGFKAAYVHIHPNRGWMFDLKRHVKDVERMNKQRENNYDDKSPLYLHKVMPYEQITLKNITMEIIECLAALGSYAGHGIPAGSLRPLAFRITLLKYWKERNEINLADVPEMEKDPIEFFRSRGVNP